MKNVVKYKSIYLTIIFKRLILTYLLIALFFIIAPFFVSQSLKVSYFNNSVDRNNTYNLFYIIWMIVSLVSLYLLYTFKKPGKQLFTIVFLASSALTLFGGPVASDPIYYTLEGLGLAIVGALLIMLYYTPISNKF
tara:strand:+ start:224 stop:631 length:408 start_codon:yes stop_codon:yes gene_type:complete